MGFFNAKRFCAIPARHAIRAQTPTGQTAVQQNQQEACAAHCLHSPCRQVSGSGRYLKYVQCEVGIEYLRQLRHVYDAHQYRMDIQPSTDLVAFEQPLYLTYWVSNRIGWGEHAARESRLQCCVNDQYFRMWHCAEFFLVPTSQRPRLHPTPPTDRIYLEALKDLCVPTSTILAYTGRRWIATWRGPLALV